MKTQKKAGLDGRTLPGLLPKYSQILLLKEAPHVHFHLLTEQEEFDNLGFYKMEMCCHSCGESVLLLYDGDLESTLKIREAFADDHKKCPDFGFAEWCPDVRNPAKTKTVDIRDMIRDHGSPYLDRLHGG